MMIRRVRLDPDLIVRLRQMKRAFSKTSLRRDSKRRGSAMVEVAVCFPVFLLILLGIIEFGRAMSVNQLLNSAARIGCRAAILDGSSNTSVTSLVTSHIASTLGCDAASITVEVTVTDGDTGTALVSVAPATGFCLPEDSTASIDILPIALDLTTWNSLLAQIYNQTNSGFSDQHRYDAASGKVSNSADGIPEVNIYPDANSAMPSGNRGTVDIGSPNNSTADLKRQIQHGINGSDLNWFPNGELRFNDQGILFLNGDTGISAGIESALKSIIGHVRAIPIFIEVSGSGNNAQFTITRFVGVRIMAVKLTGGPSQRYLRVQPAPYTTRYALRGNVPVTVDGIMSQPMLIE
jgi:Flp pilus assembly protein TadG